MTDQPTGNVAASVRRRLLNLSTARRADYNAILVQYAIERFLYRLSKSPWADKFVLKGAMLFRVWAADLHRPTRDLDLLGFGDAGPEAVVAAVRQIISTQVADDGLRFSPETVSATEIREQQEYGGVRVTLVAMLGNARIPMQVDVGFGDAVTPPAKVAQFPTLLKQDAPTLRMYPSETVIAEKLEAIVRLGMANSRMKDYYDLLVLFRVLTPDQRLLTEAIAATFRRREMPIPERTPTGLSDEFAQDRTAQRLWREFLTRLRIENAPPTLGEAIAQIWPHVEAALRAARQVT